MTHPTSKRSTEYLQPTEECKYIVFDKNGIEMMVVFPSMLKHDIFKNFKPLCAGFIRNGRCFGNSESLELKSRPMDNDLLDVFIKPPLGVK